MMITLMKMCQPSLKYNLGVKRKIWKISHQKGSEGVDELLQEFVLANSSILIFHHFFSFSGNILILNSIGHLKTNFFQSFFF